MGVAERERERTRARAPPSIKGRRLHPRSALGGGDTSVTAGRPGEGGQVPGRQAAQSPDEETGVVAVTVKGSTAAA